LRRGNAGDFWAAFGTPVFCVAKGDYYRAALLQKNRAFEEGVLWRHLFRSLSPAGGRKAEKTFTINFCL
jgi:hypothetical protein